MRKRDYFVMVLIGLFLISSVGAVSRSFSESEVNGGDVVTVILEVILNSSQSFYLIDETLPDSFVIINDGGGSNVDLDHLKWVVTFGAVSTNYTYQVRVPIIENTTNYTIFGDYFLSGMSNSLSILGGNVISVNAFFNNETNQTNQTNETNQTNQTSENNEEGFDSNSDGSSSGRGSSGGGSNSRNSNSFSNKINLDGFGDDGFILKEKEIGEIVFELIKAERISEDKLKVIYSIDEIFDSEQDIVLQFFLFNSDNEQVAEFTELRTIPAGSSKEFKTLIPIDASLEGKLNLLVNLNSERYTGFIQEDIFLGRKSITGFSVFGEEGLELNKRNIIIFSLVGLFLIVIFFIVRKIMKMDDSEKGMK